MLISGILIAIALIMIAFRAPRCPNGGRHTTLLVGRLYSEYELSCRDVDKVKMDGYIELHECSKCKKRWASRWIDWQRWNGDSDLIDVPYAEEQLRKAGILKETMQG